MAIQQTTNFHHWNYFLALEQDVERLARFIEFNEKNFNTYSIEIAHLYLAAASEVDVIAKQLCAKANPNSSPKNIEEYRITLAGLSMEIANTDIFIPSYGLTLSPWSNWRDEKAPTWWSDHNKVKHQRDSNFDRANLKNVLNTMAGLFTLVLYNYRSHITSIEPPPSLFIPPNNLARITTAISGGARLFFTVPNP